MTATRFSTAHTIVPLSIHLGERRPVAALRLVAVSSLPELESHAPAWNCLALAAPERLPMLSYAFIRPYLEYQLEARESWHVMFAYEGERLVGVLPLIISRDRVLGAFRTRLRTPSNPHIISVSPLTAAGYEDRASHFLLAEASRLEPQFASLSCQRLHCDSKVLALADQRLEDVHALKEPAGNGSFLPIIGSLPQYAAGLSSNWQRNLRRWAKWLSALPSVSMEFLAGADASSELFEQFMQLEASGWKGNQGSAILSSPRRAEFYRALVEKLRTAGWLELHVLRADNKLLAGHLAMRMHRTLVLWKIAYDETYANCGPGNLLLQKTIERAFLSGDIDEINCLTDMEWHHHWNMKQRPYYNLYFYPRRPLPYLLEVVPKETAKLLRTLPGVRPLVNSLRGLLS